MRYRTSGDKVTNFEILNAHVIPSGNHVNTMKDQLVWLDGRLRALADMPITPDPAGECDGLIADPEEFAKMHEAIGAAAVAVTRMYRDINRRIDREIARTKLQAIDGQL